jgi:hypothetical protein
MSGGASGAVIRFTVVGPVFDIFFVSFITSLLYNCRQNVFIAIHLFLWLIHSHHHEE